MREKTLGILLVLPSIIIIAFWTVYPLIFFLSFSFTNAQLGPEMFTGLEFVGLKQFTRIANDPTAIAALKNTFVFISLGTAMTISLALAIGLFLNLDFRGVRIVRALVLIPWVLAPVVVSLLWKWMMQSQQGLFNWILIWLGILDKGIAWLGDPHLAMFSVTFIMTWYLTPFFSVMIIAGLHGIDPELYDAADVDGAGSFGKFRYISLPALQYPLVIGGLIAAIWFGNNFDIIYASTMGGPGSSTTTLTLYLHKVMWSWFEVGYASAISAVNYGLLLAFSVIFLYLFRKYWRE